MKGLITLLFLLASMSGFAQEELRVHHINVGDGDATFIGIYNTATGVYTRSILIDGGASNPDDRLLPYLRNIQHLSVPKVNYMILTHYHKDHYNGLLSIKDGRLHADSVADPGGYAIGTIFPAQMALSSPAPAPAPEKLVVTPAWLTALKTAAASGYLQGHSSKFYQYGGSAGTGLGQRLILGSIAGQPVTLECVAGWGNTLNGGGISPDPAPSKDNANNFSLSFILQCGEFRYFIGGDLGGKDTNEYIDQESKLSSYFAAEYPSAWSWNHNHRSAGHLCGFKADHHGSNHSNNKKFLEAMQPAVAITSAGSQASWQLPHPDYLKRLANLKPISVWVVAANQTFNRGVYVTNLYNFSRNQSKNEAIALFDHKSGVSFSYGNNDTGAPSSYFIKVKADGIATKSQFQSYRADDNGNTATLLGNFFCHTK